MLPVLRPVSYPKFAEWAHGPISASKIAPGARTQIDPTSSHRIAPGTPGGHPEMMPPLPLGAHSAEKLKA